MKNKITIIDALEDGNLFKPILGKNPKTWNSWKVFLKAVFGLAMDDREFELFKKHTGRTERPVKRFDEIFAIVGRRGGKSIASSLIACYIVLFEDWWLDELNIGERAVFPVISNDKVQSRIIYQYIIGILKSNDMFKDSIERETIIEIQTNKRVDIRIMVQSFRTIRGATMIGAVLDELSFWRDSATFANPASEIIQAIRPAIMEGGLLIGISSAFNCEGVLYDEYREYFGKNDPDSLIWVATTQEMNPTFSKKKIEKALKKDKAHAMAEYFSAFREDIAGLYSLIAVENSIIPGRRELFPKPGIDYKAFADPSSGRRDSFGLSIGHVNEYEKIIIDLAIEKKSPFKPSDVISEFAGILKAYKISEVTCDRYAVGFVVDLWEKQGITQKESELTASELYLYLLPLFSDNRVELPDIPRLKTQLMSLMRKTSTGGKDSVIVLGSGDSHADMSNAVAGAAWLLSQGSDSGFISTMEDYNIFTGQNLGGVNRRNKNPSKMEKMGKVIKYSDVFNK